MLAALSSPELKGEGRGMLAPQPGHVTLRDSSQGEGRNWAVAIVHGIGATEPVQMLHLVSDALTTAGKPAQDKQSAEPPGPRIEIALEPKITIERKPGRHEQHTMDGWLPDGSRVRFATALWSDIAKVSGGPLSLMGSILLGGFGVRYFAEVGSDTGRSFLAKALHKVLDWMIILLAMVLLPVTMCLTVYGTVALVAYAPFHDKTLWMQTPFIAGFGLVIVVIIERIARGYLRQQALQRTLIHPVLNSFLLIGIAMFVLLLAGMRYDESAPFSYRYGGKDSLIAQAASVFTVGLGQFLQHDNWVVRAGQLDTTGIYFGLLYSVQDLGGLIEIVLALFALLLLFATWFDPRIDWRMRRSLRLSVISVVSMWLVMLLLLWPEKIITSLVMTYYSGYYKADRAKENVEFFREVVAWDFTAGKPWHGTKYIPGDYYHALWFDWMFLVFLLATLLTIVILLLFRTAANQLRSRKDFNLSPFKPASGKAVPRKQCWPRLVVSSTYVLLVLLLMCCCVMVVSAEILSNPILGLGFRPIKWLEDNIAHEVIIRYGIMTTAVLVAIFGFLFIANAIRDAVKLMLDVVNHFVAPGQGFPVRREISQRLIDTLDHLTSAGDKPHLVVIAHSQGTVIALDTIFGSRQFAASAGSDTHPAESGILERAGLWKQAPDGWTESLKDRVSSLTILTFGSPITNVYQHYFGHMYPPFAKTLIADIDRKDQQVKWFNTYRIDDFVGTYIDNSIPNFPVNVPVTTGGHTKYWEAEVFKVLFAESDMQSVLRPVAAKRSRAS